MMEIVTFISTISPGLASIAVILFLLFYAAKELRGIINLFKNDASALVKKDEELIARLDEALVTNEELRKTNNELKAGMSILCDQLAHIDNYIEKKMKEAKEKEGGGNGN